MSSRQDASITSYFQPTGEQNSKSKTMDMSKPGAAAPEAVPKSQIKAKDKRPLSTSPPAPAAKRSNIDMSTSDTQQKHLSYNNLTTHWLDDSATLFRGCEVTDKKAVQLTYHFGDMFKDAPKNCLLIHACNTQGHWGAGIAKVFKQHYPKAYTAHHKFCAKDHSKTNPIVTGSAQLLAPVDADSQHWIGCLFTSEKYGKAKDKPEAIVRNTTASMQMLLELVRIGGKGVDEIRMCKINSGKFGVPWEKTEEALKAIVLQEGWRNKIEIWEP